MTSRTSPRRDRPLPAAGGTRTSSGGTYGDFVPTESAAHDPSRGAEMERDSMGPGDDFSKRPPYASETGSSGSTGSPAAATPAPESEMDGKGRVALKR